jgi:L-cysteate sulfo-lyase
MRVALGTWPTPVEETPRLAEAIGLPPDRLRIKRDDLGGLGAGGNKIRKLEWTVGAALTEGADTLVTTGAPQSNHARLTAAAAARLGLDAVLVFPGEPGRSRSGNLALDGLFGARVHWAGDGADLNTAADEITEKVRRAGRRPYRIPFGGSSDVSARGYRDAGRELLDQVPDLGTVVVALGSGGTMAGLVAALGPDRVLGVDVGAMADPGTAVAAMASAAGESSVPKERLRVRTDQVGDGYPHLTGPASDALALTARTTGIVLDPVYTARAMAGLIASVADGSLAVDAPIVFVHTGGLPGFFGHPDAVETAERALRTV